MSRKYIFTDKQHTYYGVMSTIMGVIDILTIVLTVYNTYLAGGTAPDRYASTILLVMVFAFIGIILGFVGKSESEKFYLFAYLGIVLNILAIVSISGILYAGAYGL